MMRIKRGVMLIKDGMGWGKVYEDSYSTSWGSASHNRSKIRYGWMPIEDASIHDPRYCTKPSDVTYSGDHNLPEIRKGKLVKVVKRTTVLILPDDMMQDQLDQYDIPWR
jgi:hypothetical protein